MKDGIHGNGCVTFDTALSGSAWPCFLELLADPEGASIMPCSWATANGAGIPGLQCDETSNPTGISDTDWDLYEESLSPTGTGDYVGNSSFPVPGWVTYLRWHMVGSGPYYLSNLTVGAGYQLSANPNWVGTGCSWTGCIPASFPIDTVNTVWESNPSVGEAALKAGQADFASVPASDYSDILIPLLNAGNVTISYAPSFSIGFTNFDFNFSQSGAQSLLPAGTNLSAPSNLFQDLAFRQFLEHSYPYQTVQSEYNTIDGIIASSLYGGAIPNYMGNYYPTNISWDFKDPNATGNDTAGWWWSQVENESDGIAAAACTRSDPCTFPLASYTGAANLDRIDNLWANEVSLFSNNAVKIVPVDIPFNNLVVDSFSSIGTNPMPLYNLWLTPNYPDPTDDVTQLYAPDSTYTYSDSVAESLGIYTNACSPEYVWSVTSVTDSCQGSAYSTMVSFLTKASVDTNPDQRSFLYNAAEHIAQQLGIFVPNPGQNMTVWVAASWIDNGNESLNTNPVIGGNGDSTWYTITYAPKLPVIDSFAAIPSTISLGSWTNFTVRANGGTGHLTYAYSGLPRGCYSANLTILSCDPVLPGVYNVTVNVADQAGHHVANTTTLTVIRAPPTLSSVTVTPANYSVRTGETTSPFTATPICSGTCPSGSTYYWTLSNGSMGTLSPTMGNTVTFTASNTSGIVILFASVTLDGVTRHSLPVNITIYPSEVSTLASVEITPSSSTVTTGESAIFTLSVKCNLGPCTSGLTYSWSLSQDLGSLSPRTVQTMVFTAGSTSGTLDLDIMVTSANVTKDASAIITITSPTVSTSSILGLPAAEGYALLVGLLSSVAVLSIGAAYGLRRISSENDNDAREYPPTQSISQVGDGDQHSESPTPKSEETDRPKN
jgi:hypothetical protein